MTRIVTSPTYKQDSKVEVRECCQCPLRSSVVGAPDVKPECNIDGGVTPKRGMPRWCPLHNGPITIRRIK